MSLQLLAVLAQEKVVSAGSWAAILLLFAVALVVLIVIDDDDLPGPRLCRVKAT